MKIISAMVLCLLVSVGAEEPKKPVKESELAKRLDNYVSPLRLPPVKKVPATGRVLQVLDEGLLFAWGSWTYLLVGHPDQEKMADGDPVNCYMVETAETFKYTDIKRSVRTARIYRYTGRRLGKR